MPLSRILSRETAVFKVDLHSSFANLNKIFEYSASVSISSAFRIKRPNFLSYFILAIKTQNCEFQIDKNYR